MSLFLFMKMVCDSIHSSVWLMHIPTTIHPSIHPSIHPFSLPASSVQGRKEAGAYLQRSMGERWGAPWTGRQSLQGNTETHRTNNHAHTHSVLREIERDQLT
ncbi:hypothetical protein ATANTOWER_021845 [Ataeniobius toweri]|uniref:Secreted protein n=1 Tax=Ataeniobius toweri TaxID=208326 RepID=A0ABU7B8G6_9TELE|nr:hypothetical protein [Ataeniobius toweri]